MGVAIIVVWEVVLKVAPEAGRPPLRAAFLSTDSF
jgi:hypothetical protein